MKPEDKVITLEQAKKLVKLGIRRESEHIYFKNDLLNIEFTKTPEFIYKDNFYPAYDIPELMEMLPREIFLNHPIYNTKEKYTLQIHDIKRVQYEMKNHGGYRIMEEKNNLVQNIGNIVIRSLENGYITAEDVNKEK